MIRRRLLLPALVVSCVLGCGSPPRPNILLVTFDTVRADHVGYAVGRPGLTPMLDALAERGVWFSTCFASQPLTLPSHTSIMTGLEPYHHGVRNNGTYVVPPDVETLAERLGQTDYVTHAIVSAFVLDSQFGLDQGFDSYDDDLSAGPQQKMFMFKEVPATETASKAIRWLQQGRPPDEPFFLWLHFFDPHADYQPPAQVAAHFPGQPYRAEIAYADLELGRILASLEDLGLIEKTLVVFTSDHGESLGEHGERTHGIFVYDATTKVPLLLAGPGVPTGDRVDDLVRTIDIVPTILDLLGLGGESDLDGASLQPLWNGDHEERTAYSETLMPRLNFGWSELRSLRDDRYKVIEAPRPEAYDLNSDPGELTDLRAAGNAPSESAELASGLEGITAADPFARGEHQPVEISGATRDKLAALGYVTSHSEGEHRGRRPDPKDRIDYWERFQSAQDMMRAGDYELARAAIQDLLEVDPDNVVAMGSLANALARTGHEDQALEVYRRMMTLDPNRETAYLGAARILRKRGSFEDASELAKAVIEMQPSDPNGYVALGDTLLEQGLFAEAEVLFRKALEIDPHSMLAVSGLGNCLNRAGRVREAAELLREAREHDPSNHAVTYNLAVVSEHMGDEAAALALYRQAIRLDPEHSMSWNNLGSLLNRLGDRRQGLEMIRKARELDPDNVEATYNLGALLFVGGEAEQALPLLEEALARKPDFLLAAVFRARCLTSLGRTSEALHAWYQLAPHRPEAWLQVARIELDRGRREAARQAVANGLAAGGDRTREAVENDAALSRFLE